MRTRIIIFFSTLFLAGSLIALPLARVVANRAPIQNPAPPQVSSVPISEEHHHHLVLANSFMQAYEVEVPPHDSTLLHRHDQDYVYIVFGDADITNAVENKKPLNAHLTNTMVN